MRATSYWHSFAVLPQPAVAQGTNTTLLFNYLHLRTTQCLPPQLMIGTCCDEEIGNHILQHAVHVALK